jgi:MFS family permease
MADEKPSGLVGDEKVTTPTGSHESPAPGTGPVARPPGVQYKGVRLLGKEYWYASPPVQLFMVSMVCFLCPGMFNALGGMGGMGLEDTKIAARANTALYSCFAVVAFFAGTIANKLGLRVTLGLGGIGYSVYVASFFAYKHVQNNGFVVFAGALLGVCAGMLWTAQGAIMMSYPHERSKGKYISWFWMIFNFGGVIGSLIPLGQNIKNSSNSVNDGTYAAFLVLTFLGAILSFTLANARSIIRDDGSKVILMKNPTWKTELLGLWETIREAPWIVLLFPIFWSSNTFYTYQLNNMNGAHFSIRTRALNSTLYWAAQILGALVFGYALDFPGTRRTTRAKASFAALVVLTFALWGGGWAWQKKQVTRQVVEDTEVEYDRLDWTEDGYIPAMFLFFFYGFFDAVWQTTIYWWMGAISNSGRKTANLAGFYKGLQSAGAAVWWDMDRRGMAYNKIFGATVRFLSVFPPIVPVSVFGFAGRKTHGLLTPFSSYSGVCSVRRSSSPRLSSGSRLRTRPTSRRT